LSTLELLYKMLSEGDAEALNRLLEPMLRKAIDEKYNIRERTLKNRGNKTQYYTTIDRHMIGAYTKDELYRKIEAYETSIKEKPLKELLPEKKGASDSKLSPKEAKILDQRYTISEREVKGRNGQKQYYTTVNRRMIAASSKNALYKKLMELECGKEFRQKTLNDLVPEYLIWKRDHTAVTSKTIKESKYLYDGIIRDAQIASKAVTDIKTSELISYFREITKDRTVTRKKFCSIKSLLSGIFAYAVMIELIEINPVTQIGNTNQFAFKAVNRQDKVYTAEERQKILNYLKDSSDIYDLAICLDFHLVTRVGELLALKWDDIEGQNIHIQRSLNLVNEINDDLSCEKREIIAVDHIKGNADAGFRMLPITPGADEILKRIKALGIDSEYIFADKNGKFLLTDTLNEHLRKICKNLGIQYHSSHSIRFTTASLLFDAGLNMTEIQKLLGHTTLAMTQHYLRSVKPDDSVRDKMAEIL